MFGLANILSPLDVEEFCSGYKGQKSLHIPSAENKFEGLFGWDDINHVLNYGRPTLDRVKLVNNKVTLPAESLNQIDIWLLKGATLVIDSVNHIDPVVSKFSNALSNDMNTHVNINCYASFPNKQGFDIHFDRHDVFIIQISGSKTWKVFDPTIEWPIERQPKVKHPPPEYEPYLECTLQTSDVLYIPRGHWHYALADDPSIHLTVGPQSRSPVDFLNWLVGYLMENESELRKDFPIIDVELMGGSRSDDDLDLTLNKVYKNLGDVFESDRIRELFREYCMTTNSLRRNYDLPKFVILSENLSAESEFKIAAEQKSIIDYNDDDCRARILLRGHVMFLGPIPKAALECVFNSDSVVTGNLILQTCPELQWEQVKIMLTELHSRGVIVTTD